MEEQEFYLIELDTGSPARLYDVVDLLRQIVHGQWGQIGQSLEPLVVVWLPHLFTARP